LRRHHDAVALRHDDAARLLEGHREERRRIDGQCRVDRDDDVAALRVDVEDAAVDRVFLVACLVEDPELILRARGIVLREAANAPIARSRHAAARTHPPIAAARDGGRAAGKATTFDDDGTGTGMGTGTGTGATYGATGTGRSSITWVRFASNPPSRASTSMIPP